MMLNTVKTLIPSHLRKQIKPFFEQWRDTVLTEYNFQTKRQLVRDRLAQLRGLPRVLHIEGTNTCNAKCVFCAYPQMERPKQVMPLEDFKRTIDEYMQLGGKYISMTPIVGDPFVDPHLFQRLDYLYQHPQIEGFYFYTNAILMKPEVSEKLLTYADKLQIYVSWGGFDRETYKAIMGVDRFERVSRNVEAFVEAKRRTNSPIGFTIALRCPEAKRVGDLWEKFCSYQRERLLKIEYIESYDSWAGKVESENLKQLDLRPRLMPYKRGACELLFTDPIVLANRQINACACRDVEAELIVGDLKDSSLSDIFTGDKIGQLIERHEQGDFPDICKRCTWYVSIYNTRQSKTLKPLFNWQTQTVAKS